ncbi:MAG: glycosyltransferase [Acidocella sp.]|nr:glycosyltransferase [Acidocella sp.]
MQNGVFSKADSPRIGIAVTTYNRRALVCRQAAALRQFTEGNYALVFCDDGSNDGTPQALREAGEIVIQGVNRGIAWNKNRGIFYLMAVCGCDIVILLDDDMLPDEPGWQARWVQGADRFGMVNYIPEGRVPGLDATTCTPQAPGLTTDLLGACIAFHRYAWAMVGYMNPRFQRYGHEHTEFTNRFLRNGFGGVIKGHGDQAAYYYFVICGGIQLAGVTSHGTAEDVALNARIWQEIEALQQHTFSPPWINDAERMEFLAEIRLSQAGFSVCLPRQSEDFAFRR